MSSPGELVDAIVIRAIENAPEDERIDNPFAGRSVPIAYLRSALGALSPAAVDVALEDAERRGVVELQRLDGSIAWVKLR